ncbi:MAG: YkgJ family cysteine cluster protein [Archaeoglobaceae archaeon]|nr:YkgJ family cysteine cluster protein [Archaeoglobaceae archaeon]MCX8151944.1 YkgJ family cysteine cluster protein [Archaeoglobaceae archaeon]MDW8013333.1 YkgJ family cysteine cluster protein [Archaeoglobaceae archaeon]
MKRFADVLNFIDFKDICCGCKANCCRRFYAVLLSEEESEFESVYDEIYTQFGPIKTLGNLKSACPFLSKDGLCTIYQRRPFDCKVWPIVMYLDLETNDRIVYLDMDCEAVKDDRIPRNLIEKIVEVLKNLPVDDDWLKRYTSAPWPNNFIEIARFKTFKNIEK